MPEFDETQKRIQTLIKERGLDTLVLQRVSNISWATCGAASFQTLLHCAFRGEL